MDALIARVEETPEGQVVLLPRGVGFSPLVKEVRVHQSGDTLTLSRERTYLTGEELARRLKSLPRVGEIGERLPVDIPDRG